MKATAKCDQHCGLHDSVIERILFFRIILESMSWMVVFFFSSSFFVPVLLFAKMFVCVFHFLW